MCEVYRVEYSCGCILLKYIWKCKPRCVGSSMISWPGVKKTKDQLCKYHGGPYDSENEYED